MKTLAPVRAPLSPERIVAVSIALIEQDGLAAFSTRKLGAALGVEAMSIYHHFPSKQHLFDALVDHLISLLPAVRPDRDPIARLRQLAHDHRAMAHRFPKFYPFIAVHRLNTPTGVAWIERTLKLFLAAAEGDLRLAAENFRAVGYYLVGACLDETSGYAKGPSAANPVADAVISRDCPTVASAARYFQRSNWDRTFELGLETLLSKMPAAAPTVKARKPVTRRTAAV